MTLERSIVMEHTTISDHSQAEVGSRAVQPILVQASRGGVVEATHRVHAVAVRGGEIVAAAGDPSLVTFFRSSAKPLQAQACPCLNYTATSKKYDFVSFA